MDTLLEWTGGREILVSITVFCLLVQAATLAHVVANKKDQPTSALLWIFVILNLSLLGVIAYLLVGVNRLPEALHRFRRSDRRLGEATGRSAYTRHVEARMPFLSPSKEDASAVRDAMLDRLMPSSAPIGGNAIKLLTDGTEAYPEMIEAINAARRHVHLQSYIIMDDDEGERLFKALRRKARGGVPVKVLFDRLGSARAYSSHFFNRWSQGADGLRVCAFSTFNILAPWRIQLRNHRKLMVVDGEVGFVGGLNISKPNATPAGGAGHIHDLHAKIEGPAVGDLQYNFVRDWCHATGDNPSAFFGDDTVFPIPVRRGSGVVRICYSGPGQRHEGTEKLFMAAAASARASLWIASPYFVPDLPFLKALQMAAARRVDVRVITPRNNNHWYVRQASRSHYAALLEAGVRVFERRGTFSHVKAMLVDGQWGVMGSSNCDNRSFRLNYELDFVAEDSGFIADLHAQLMEELDESEEVTLPLRASLREELLQGFCSLFSPIL